jgi:hypothetical protein
LSVPEAGGKHALSERDREVLGEEDGLGSDCRDISFGVGGEWWVFEEPFESLM